MAQTPAAIEAIHDVQGTNRICKILKHIPKGVSSTIDLWLVQDLSGSGLYEQKATWVQTTASETAAQQSAAILTAMAPAI